MSVNVGSMPGVDVGNVQIFPVLFIVFYVGYLKTMKPTMSATLVCHFTMFTDTLFRPTMEEAKEVHKCLRIAAGIFKLIKVRMSLII